MSWYLLYRLKLLPNSRVAVLGSEASLAGLASEPRVLIGPHGNQWEEEESLGGHVEMLSDHSFTEAGPVRIIALSGGKTV